MLERVRERLADILGAIENVEDLISERRIEAFRGDRHATAALERYLEIVSEASRHIPAELKAAHPNIAWRSVADLGNRLRHEYRHADLQVLWLIQETGELSDLKAAVQAMLGEP